MSPYRTAEYVEREPLRCWDCESTIDVREIRGGVAFCRRCFRDEYMRSQPFAVHPVQRTAPLLLGVEVDDDAMRWAGLIFVRNATPYE